MAHFAEIDENNIVLRVLVVPDEQEDRGQEYLSEDLGLGGTWIQTSYTSRDGNRVDPETNEVIEYGNHFRFNFAVVGSIFMPDLGPDGIFVAPSPFPSWTFNEETFYWDPPVSPPEDFYDGEHIYIWDEETLSWVIGGPRNDII